jgi:hypothetical protein
MSLSEPFDVTLRLASVFVELEVEYLVGGSVASSVHGVPRATNDVDLVARLAGRHVDAFVAALRSDFYVDADMIHDAIRRRASFNVVHLATMLKADVFVFDGSAQAHAELSRKQAIEVVVGEPAVWFSSPEDIVLQKLAWYRKGNEVSERQWTDVLGVLQVSGPRLDLTYLNHWAAQLGLTSLLERAWAMTKP